jgi:hypothetical protein
MGLTIVYAQTKRTGFRSPYPNAQHKLFAAPYNQIIAMEAMCSQTSFDCFMFHYNSQLMLKEPLLELVAASLLLTLLSQNESWRPMSDTNGLT